MAHMVPHVEIEANGNAALGGCCSRFSDEAVVVYKDDRFELTEYNINCCSRGDKRRRRRHDATIEELDRRFREAYQVNFRDISGGDIDLTEGVTFVQFKAIRNQAFHDRLVRRYGVTLKKAVDALHIDIDPVRGLSALEAEQIEAWAKRNGNQQETEYDVPLSPMPSLEEMPERSDRFQPLAAGGHPEELLETERQRVTLAGLVQRAVLQVVDALTPRQIQALRRGTDSQRTMEERKSVEESKSTAVKKELVDAIEVDT